MESKRVLQNYGKVASDLTRRNFIKSTTLAATLLPLTVTRAADEVAQIKAALPTQAPATPKRMRRLLIFSLNVNYGGHTSIATAEKSFTLMGEQSGAFETVISRDPAVFEQQSLEHFDAVFFNNTVGNLFKDDRLRRNLREFVWRGGGLLSVHGTAVAFLRWGEDGKDDWPEFGAMLGTRGAHHRAADEKVFMKLDDPSHPVVRPFGGKGFVMQDEFFRPKGNYSRNRSRILLSFDLEKSRLANEPRDGCYREDQDYAMAWVRPYGRGRVFHAAFGHQPDIFKNPTYLDFFLAATQFVLGDLPAPVTPSARLTPTMRAQEKLGWRLGVEAYTFHKFTLFETIEKTAALGLAYAGGLSFQKVSHDIPKNLAPGLSDEELQAIRLKLDDAGTRLLTYYYQSIPNDETACRQVFEFGRQLGIECFMSEPDPAALPLIDRFCQEYDIKVGLHNHDRKASPHYWHPEVLLKTCKNCSPYIGACADIGYWMRENIDPIKGVEMLRERLITLQMHDLDTAGSQGQDVPWGTGQGQSEALLKKLHEMGVTPVMFGLEYSRDWLTNESAVKQCADFFGTVSQQLVK